MQCPYCNYKESKVVDSRHTDSKSIRRRRECESCKKRFTTYEVIETTPIMVVKKDNSRELFDREKIKKGINLKAQGFSDQQIIRKLRNIENPNNETTVLENNNPMDLPSNIETNEIMGSQQNKPELRNLTLDVTTQTLQMLAESVAKKITEDIKNSDMAEKLIEAGGYKKDNEILSQQVQELIDHNKKLSERIEQLEKREGFFQKLIGLFR